MVDLSRVPSRPMLQSTPGHVLRLVFSNLILFLDLSRNLMNVCEDLVIFGDWPFIIRVNELYVAKEQRWASPELPWPGNVP